MYVVEAGGGVDDAEDVEAMAASSGFPLTFPLALGPCPSIPPPLAKQCAASCYFLPQFVHKTPSGFFSCLCITPLAGPAWLQYSEPGPDFPAVFEESMRWHSTTRRLMTHVRRVSGAAGTVAWLWLSMKSWVFWVTSIAKCSQEPVVGKPHMMECTMSYSL